MEITNNSGINLSLAVWLLADDYDYINEPNYISVTRLMRPLKQIVLGRRVEQSDKSSDLVDFIARARGNAIHDSVEKAWKNGHKRALKMLGYPEDVVELVLINPTSEELAAVPNAIPVYLEQRAIKSHRGYQIGGKFDQVIEGIVQDFKSTTAYTWQFGGRDDEHQLQGSLYRWLNPDKITEDFIRINYIFTDWSKMMARSNPKYPDLALKHKDIPLMSVVDTENWINNKLTMIEQYLDKPETAIPDCSDEELWRSDPKYKYFSDPEKAKDPNSRSTKNFDSLKEANTFWHQDKGGKGVVITIPGEVKRCSYCEAAPICEQRKRYFPDD